MLRRATLSVLAIGAALCCVSPMGAWADRAFDILRESVRADGRVAYSATVEIRLYKGGKRVGTYVQEVVRDVGNRRRVKVLSPPHDAGRLIISDGRTEWEYRPKQNVVRERPVPPLDDVQRHRLGSLDLVRATLHATYAGTETVAGRECHVIAVKPPDGKQTRKKMWIDTERNVELRWARYAPNGQLLITWTVTGIDFAPDIASNTFKFDAPAGAHIKRIPPASRMPLSAAEEQAGFPAIIPSYLPKGFAFHEDRVGVTKAHGRTALWLPFVNGVDSFSIFQSRGLKGPPPKVPRAMCWEAQGYFFVLVGRLPHNEKEKIKESTQK